MNFNGTGSQTIPGFTYYNLQSSSTGGRTLDNSSEIGILNTFTPGSNPYTTTGSTVDYLNAGSATIAAFNYYNLKSSNAGARTLASSGIIGVAGTFTPGSNSYTITGSTIDYNGSTAQTLASGFSPYYNLTINNSAGSMAVDSVTVNGTLEVANLASVMHTT